MREFVMCGLALKLGVKSPSNRTLEAAKAILASWRVLGSVTNVTLPTNEGQARPLIGLEPPQQRDVWQEAVETAPNGKLTAAHVEAGRNGGQGIEHVRFLLGSEQKVRTYSRSSS